MYYSAQLHVTAVTGPIGYGSTRSQIRWGSGGRFRDKEPRRANVRRGAVFLKLFDSVQNCTVEMLWPTLR